MNYKDLRKDYMKHSMDPHNLADDPCHQFIYWFEEALQSKVEEANAMACATVNQEGKPSCRYVLFKELIDGKFIFFTNYLSRKGQDLETNAHCALVFYWRELERQIRIEGIAQKTSYDYSNAYFNSRPLGSRISSLVSPQSQVIGSKQSLEDQIEKLSSVPDSEIKMPSHWGAYGVKPEVIEFWQGRRDRLHDRVRYRKIDSNNWIKEILAP